MNSPRRYTSDEIAFLKENIKGRLSSEIADLFNAKFSNSITAKQVAIFKKNHNIPSGVVTRFNKGHEPANKGTKGISKPNKTSFKKGQVPKNVRPVGSERTDKDGYTLVKISEPNKWALKHRVEWENVNGKIPPKHALIFLDGNKQNIDLGNLKLIPIKQNLILNNKKLRFNDKELTEAGLLISEVLMATNDKRKEKR